MDRHADDFLHGTTLPKPLTLLLDPGDSFTNAYGVRWNAPQETASPTSIVLAETGKIMFVKIRETHGGRSAAEEVLTTW
ncbi:MAG: redoxin family protein [Phycisphaera sp. RhM]|nr:redoxin family protein [Phycisphaera sp. RhM]